MKKIMMSFAIAALLSTTTAVMANNVEETFFQDKTKSEEETPKFSSDEANKAVAEFKKIIDEYGPFLAKNDPTKSAEFGEKIQTWSMGVQTWMAKLSPEEQQTLGTYLDAYAKKYAPAEAAAPVDTAPTSITD